MELFDKKSLNAHVKNNMDGICEQQREKGILIFVLQLTTILLQLMQNY